MGIQPRDTDGLTGQGTSRVLLQIGYLHQVGGLAAAYGMYENAVHRCSERAICIHAAGQFEITRFADRAGFRAACRRHQNLSCELNSPLMRSARRKGDEHAQGHCRSQNFVHLRLPCGRSRTLNRVSSVVGNFLDIWRCVLQRATQANPIICLANTRSYGRKFSPAVSSRTAQGLRR